MTLQNIIFVRHGEGLHNARLPHGPYTDVPLTDHGVETAAQVTERLGTANVFHDPEVIFSTTHLRGQQTAENYREAHSDVPFILNDNIKEWHNFDVEPNGTMTSESKKPLWEQIFKLCDPDLRGNELGETFREFVTRVQRARHDLLNDSRNRIVCFSHALFMLALVLDLQGALHATPDCISALNVIERVKNLDIVHIQHDRATGQLTITSRQFKENYGIARSYPYIVAAVEDEKQVV